MLLAIVGIFFFMDSRKMNNKFYLWVSLFFFLFIPARICRIVVRFVLGEPPIGDVFTGEVLVVQILYMFFAIAGLFFIFFGLERTLLKKTHYLFSVVVWIFWTVSVIDLIIRQIFFITMALFMFTIWGLPVIFLNLARKSSGTVRKNAITVTVGVLLFEFGIAFDIPDARILWVGIADIFLAVAPAIMQILAVIILRKGFHSEL